MIAASSSRVLTVAVLFAIGAGVTTARAQTNWNTTVGSWFVPGNWDNGVPNAATTVTTVVNGGSAQIANAPADAGALLIIGGATGGTVEILPGGSLTAHTVQNSGNLTIFGGTLNLNGTLSSGPPVSPTTLTALGAGATLRAASSSTVTDNVVFEPGATSTLSAAAGQTLTFSPNFLTVSPLARLRIGSASDTGTVVFAPVVFNILSAGTQTYEVAGGTWRAGNGALGTLTFLGQSTTVDAGATLDLNDFNTNVVRLLGAGQVTTGVNAATTLALALGNFAGTISGAGQVNVNGGTTILTGTNTYTGGTTINAGATLQLGNGGSIVGSVANSGNFNINSGGTLNLSGTLSSGIATSQTTLGGGTLRAATTSTVTDNVTFASGTTSTLSAAAGQTLTVNSNFTVNANAGMKFGSATDTGTVVSNPLL